MNALTSLRKFILINRDPENVAEIRSYIEANLADLAEGFSVSAETITKTLASGDDDSVLATKMLAAIKKAEASHRDLKKDGRARAAQSAANALASRATWDVDRVQLDLPALLASALTKRQDLIEFRSDDFTVAVFQATLFDLARLRRRDLTGFVDSKGLHIRWKTGGMNLRSQTDPQAGRIVLNLSPKTKAEAA
jgi:hypothetical protein